MADNKSTGATIVLGHPHIKVHDLVEELLKLPNQEAEVMLIFAELRNGKYIEDLIPVTAIYARGKEVVML